MNYRSYCKEHVLDASAGEKQGLLAIYIQSTADPEELSKLSECAVEEGRSVAVVNCFDPNDALPELIETLNETELANWFALSVSDRRARPETIELIEDYFRFLLNGLTLQGTNVDMKSLASLTRDLEPLTSQVEDLDSNHHDVAALNETEKAAFYVIKAALEDKEKWQLFSHVRACILPTIMYLSRKDSLFSGNSMLSWQDIVSGRTLLVIQLDFMGAPGESKVLSKLLSHRLSIQQGLQAIE